MDISGNSKWVESSQQGPHSRLAEVVTRNLRNPYLKPIAEHTRIAFEETEQWLKQRSGPLIMDSCCGTGESSQYLARCFPDASVIGVDRSEYRLEKHPNLFQNLPENLKLVRADLEDFWRLAERAGWKFQAHYILYPNPYPKPGQLQRRWHAGPVFSSLIALGGTLTVRSNWKIYIDEFSIALSIAGLDSTVSQYTATQAVTAFERKYWASGQPTWECVAELD